MSRRAPKTCHMGYALKISREEGKPGTWERVGFLFTTRFEAETFYWRHHRGLPYRVTGINLSCVPVEVRTNDRSDGPRKPAA